MGIPDSFFLISFVAFLLDGIVSALGTNFRGFRSAVGLIHMLPNLALASRRLHDIDRSGWFMFWPFVSVKSLYVQGTSGPNRFGPEPISQDP
ncbi:MAG TPA: DUF805 domain-containing protein [Afipia sp.]